MAKPREELLNALWLAILMTFVCPVEQILAYDEPNPDGFGFSSEDIRLPENRREMIATELAIYCASMESEAPDADVFRAKLLAISLALDPNNKKALVTNEKLKSGIQPEGITSMIPHTLADNLLKLGGALLRQDNQANVRLAGYCYSLAHTAAPKHEDAIYQNLVYRKKYKDVSWKGVITETALNSTEANAQSEFRPGQVPRPEGQRFRPFAADNAKIGGLFVMNIGGSPIGKVLDIIATVSRGNDPAKTQFRLATDVGRQMNISFDEAFTLIKQRHPHMQLGRDVRISFGDKYTPKDGGSAGLAFSLLFFGVLDGLDIDPSFALTGDVTVDWQVRKVGGIPAKLRSAALDGKKHVIIPAGNIADVEDMIILHGPQILLTLEIFSCETITQAAELIRTDRTKKIQKVMDKFASVRKYAKRVGGGKAVRSPQVQKALVNIEKAIPNHVSAHYLRKIGSGWHPSRLSLSASLSQSFLTLYPVYLALENRKHPDATILDAETLDRSLRTARRLKHMVDRKAVPLAGSCSELLAALKALRQVQTKMEDMLDLASEMRRRQTKKELVTARDMVKEASRGVVSEMQKLNFDRRVGEQMIR